ncbi:hypothetical protein E9993_14420 [Labilibacter sediminis]|nr:hypothetical protein E9993_14420 [Labilibacter sediminis]
MKNQDSKSEISNLEKQLSAPASKTNTLLLTQYILDNPQVIDTLYQLIWSGKKNIQWKATWVFEHVFLDNPELIDPYIGDMIKRFDSINSDGAKRHISKILSLSDITKNATGELINTCFAWLISELIPVAVKVHCMQILFNICTEYPDLKHELKEVIEAQLPYNSAGFKSRANKILKELNIDSALLSF